MLPIAGDGLTGLKVRASLNKVRRRDREKIARDLKRIYEVNNKKEALLGLKNLKRNWKRIYPELARSY